MKLNFIFYFLLCSFFYFSFEENTNNISYIKIINAIKNKNLKKILNNALLSRKEEKNATIDENQLINEIDSLVNNIAEKFENQIYNLTIKINKIINSSLQTQNDIIKRTRDEKNMINELLKDIKLLKEKNRQNMQYTYIIGIIIFIIFFIFCIFDYLKKYKTQSLPIGYRKTQDGIKVNNQLDIL